MSKKVEQIIFHNDSSHPQDVQEVKDALFEAVLNGKPFRLITIDGDGDNWCSHYEHLGTEYDYVEELLNIRSK